MSSKNQGLSTGAKVVIAGLAAGTVLGGAYFLLRQRGDKAEDDAFDQAPPVPKEKESKPQTSTTSTADSIEMKPAASSEGLSVGEMTPTYSFHVTAKNERAVEEPAGKGMDHKSLAPINRDGAKHYERLGVIAALPSGWQCKEEVPPVPTISMISITRPEFENAPPPSGPEDFGRIPVVLLSVEDLSVEGLTPEEYLNKSKGLAFQQMLMMTQGMYQPRMESEGPLSVGPFRLCLEYSQVTPQISMKVMNLISVESGLAYVLQLMAHPEVFQQYRPQFMDIARSIELMPPALPKSFAATSYLEVATGAHTMKVPVSWRINATTTALAAFTSGSQQKPDILTLYTNDDDAVLSAISSGTEVGEAKVGTVTVTTIQDTTSKKKKKLFTNGSFALLAQPVRTTSVTISDDFCAEMLNSVAASTAAKGVKYVSPSRQFSFELLGNKGMFLETRVGDGAIMYAPEGMNPETAHEGPPALTIRVEDPSTDPDCMGSLPEWHRRIKSEAAEGNLTEIRAEPAGGKDAVTFVTKEMVEVGPGAREERVAKVIIYVHEGRTHMLRWEGSTANFRRTERQLNGLLTSYTFL